MFNYPALLLSTKDITKESFRGQVKEVYPAIHCLRLVRNEEEALQAYENAQLQKDPNDRGWFDRNIIPLSEIGPDDDVFDLGYVYNATQNCRDRIEHKQKQQRIEIEQKTKQKQVAKERQRQKDLETTERRQYEMLRNKFEKDN